MNSRPTIVQLTRREKLDEREIIRRFAYRLAAIAWVAMCNVILTSSLIITMIIGACSGE